jgi:hypothetical protein
MYWLPGAVQQRYGLLCRLVTSWAVAAAAVLAAEYHTDICCSIVNEELQLCSITVNTQNA